MSEIVYEPLRLAFEPPEGVDYDDDELELDDEPIDPEEDPDFNW